MKDVTNKYKNMIESFECDFNLCFDDSFGITYLSQMLKRIRSNKSLMNKDLKLLKDIKLLQELSFNLRHGYCSIIDNRNIDVIGDVVNDN